jgi:NAD(P)-dependent dehydrogenase (short-subunit alcohol dehydrogenase family)
MRQRNLLSSSVQVLSHAREARYSGHVMVKPSVLDSFRLDGRRALVTGGAKGLGQVIATALAEAGADVALASRNLEDCRVAAEELARATGKRTLAPQADVTQGEQVTRLVDEVGAAWGGVDILVNNAGINLRGPATELSEADFDAVVAVNLKAPFLCARAFAPYMLQRGWGRVINLGSILSVIALPGRAPYASAKAGLLNLTRVLALEWATAGVTVNALCPGPFATEINRPLLDDPEKYKAFVAKIPMGRWGELHEVAGAVVFLASNAASYVTGSALFVDGGWTAQ